MSSDSYQLKFRKNLTNFTLWRILIISHLLLLAINFNSLKIIKYLQFNHFCHQSPKEYNMERERYVCLDCVGIARQPANSLSPIMGSTVSRNMIQRVIDFTIILIILK